jgi:hypothetical protein
MTSAHDTVRELQKLELTADDLEESRREKKIRARQIAPPGP